MNTTADLSLVSDEELHREYWRRIRARHANQGGRPKKLRPCPKCGQQLGTKELEKHAPSCEPPERFFIPRPQATGREVGAGHREYVTAEGIRLVWSGSMALPKIGATVDITMNGIGPATVEGYFMQGGYLGVMTKALNPPHWLRRQRKECRADAPQWAKDGIGCEFGAEIATLKAARVRERRNAN